MKSPWQPPFMAITAGLFAWQVHGWIWGIVVALFLFAAVPMVTAPLFWRLAATTDDIEVLARRMTWFRWAIWGLTLVAISVTGAKVMSLP